MSLLLAYGGGPPPATPVVYLTPNLFWGPLLALALLLPWG